MIEAGDVYKEYNSDRIYVVTRESPFGYDIIYTDNGEVCSDCSKLMIKNDILLTKCNNFFEGIWAAKEGLY